MKIYVASSWRNEHQQSVVKELRSIGHEVYDFRNPSPTNHGFSWSDIDPNWEDWSNQQYVKALSHPIAEEGFKSDFDAMKWADVCVLVLPCGRSAHTEAGWMQGTDRPVVVYSPDSHEPELMYKIYEHVAIDMAEVVAALILIGNKLPSLGPLYSAALSLFEADHFEHFVTRLNCQEYSALERIRELVEERLGRGVYDLPKTNDS